MKTSAVYLSLSLNDIFQFSPDSDKNNVRTLRRSILAN